MQVAATVINTAQAHEVRVRTDANARRLAIAAKAAGRGSSVNGGEFLMLALATCYCNDLFREADRLGIAIDRVEVEATAEFDGVGLGARDIRYRAQVASPAGRERIAELVRQTDAVAEIHNTLRAGGKVTMVAD
jgi:organic hydroperoxide reductase OsmC/OhrA